MNNLMLKIYLFSNAKIVKNYSNILCMDLKIESTPLISLICPHREVILSLQSRYKASIILTLLGYCLAKYSWWI